jgi:hypothetical protein
MVYREGITYKYTVNQKLTTKNLSITAKGFYARERVVVPTYLNRYNIIINIDIIIYISTIPLVVVIVSAYVCVCVKQGCRVDIIYIVLFSWWPGLHLYYYYL